MLLSVFVQHLLCYLFQKYNRILHQFNLKLHNIPVTAQNCSICSLFTVHCLLLELLLELALFSLPLWDLLRLDFEDDPREESSDRSIAN